MTEVQVDHSIRRLFWKIETAFCWAIAKLVKRFHRLPFCEEVNLQGLEGVVDSIEMWYRPSFRYNPKTGSSRRCIGASWARRFVKSHVAQPLSCLHKAGVIIRAINILAYVDIVLVIVIRTSMIEDNIGLW